jgi:glycosyltransferase involved in cell wall biosynthesis
MIGRICGEKGVHLGIDAAAAAGVPIAIGGALFPYPDHQSYFDREIAPRLARGRATYLGAVGLRRKRRLLGAALAILIPSIAPETSSLVAMEAMASGTPVIAFRQGALPHIVEHGQTGFVVDTVEAMARAIGDVGRLDRNAIREHARRHFSVERMVARYLGLYAELSASAIGAGIVSQRS